jgi:hypothetical protein
MGSEMQNKQKGANDLPNFRPRIALHQDLQATLGFGACPTIRSAADVAYCLSEMSNLHREVLVVGVLNCKSQLIRCDIISVGTTERLYLKIGDAFHPVISSNGTALFLAHNHPSGSLEPSQEDMNLTREVAKAGLLLGYTLVDHVILSKKGHRSLTCMKTLSKFFKDEVVEPEARLVAADRSTVSVAWRCRTCRRANICSVSASPQDNGVPVACAGCSNCRWLRVNNG